MTPSLQELKLVAQADVYCNDILAGYLIRQDDGSIAFTYDLHYLQDGGCA